MKRIKHLYSTSDADAWLVEQGDSIVVEQVTVVQVPYPPFGEVVIVYSQKEVDKK